MTDRQILNRIKKLDEIAKQQKALEEQAEKIRNEIKADMTEKGVDEVEAYGRIARWKMVITNRFDSKAFKAAQPKLYDAYTKASSSRRFTIA